MNFKFQHPWGLLSHSDGHFQEQWVATLALWSDLHSWDRDKGEQNCTFSLTVTGAVCTPDLGCFKSLISFYFCIHIVAVNHSMASRFLSPPVFVVFQSLPLSPLVPQSWLHYCGSH